MAATGTPAGDVGAPLTGYGRLAYLCLAKIASVALVGTTIRGNRPWNRGQNPAVLRMLVAVLESLCSLIHTQRALALENLALRQQLVVLRRARPKRLRLKSLDRIFWAWLSRLWAHWADGLVSVRPDTVVRWHRGDVPVVVENESSGGVTI